MASHHSSNLGDHYEPLPDLYPDLYTEAPFR